MEFPEFDPEELKKQSEAAENKKALIGTIGAVAQGFQNVPSSYELLYNKKLDRPDIKGTFDSIAKNVQDPWEKQKKTYEMYKAAKEGKALDRQSQDEDALRDPNNKKTMAIKAMIASKHKIDPSELEGYSQKDLMDIYGDPKKIAEIEAQAQINFDNDMAKQASSQKFTAAENAKNRANEITAKKLTLEGEGKNLPQNVYTAATYGKRLEDANKQMDQIMAGGYDPTAIRTAGINSMLPDVAKPENAKLMEQAQRNFVNAVLRRESGSAISASEFDSANKQYFPTVGDSPAVIEQKRRNRDVALAGLKTEGAKAWNKMEGNLSTAGASHNQGSSVNEAGAQGPKIRRGKDGFDYKEIGPDQWIRVK